MTRFFTLAARSTAAAALCCLVASAGAQQTFGLNDIYRAALQGDATLSAAGAQVRSSTEVVEQAKAQFLPGLSYNASYFRNDLNSENGLQNGPKQNAHELYNSSGQTLQLRQPLYRPALLAGFDGARGQLDDASQAYAAEVQSLTMRAVEGYLEVLTSQERQQLIVVQQRFAERSLDAARKRFAGGQGIRTDIDEAQARVDMVLAQQVEADQALLAARLALAEITRLPVGAVWPLDVTRLPMTPMAPLDVESWMSDAVATSPVLASLRARVRVAQATVERVGAGHKPTLDMVLQVNKSSSENVTSPSSSYMNRQIGVQLVVPLYSGGAVQSQVRQAWADQSRAEDVLEAERRALKLRVHKEWRGMTDGARKVAALEQAVHSAQRVTVSVSRSFEGGFRTVLDVLDAEERAQTARRDLLTARLQYAGSRLRLLSFAGKLDAQRVNEANEWFAAMEGVVGIVKIPDPVPIVVDVAVAVTIAKPPTVSEPAAAVKGVAVVAK